MARRQSDESKQGMIISIVAFVILFLLASVIAFLGYSEAGTYKEKYNTAFADAEKYKKRWNQERARIGVLRLAIGAVDEEDRAALDKDEHVESYDALKRQYPEEIKQEIEGLEGIDWQVGMDRPGEGQTYMERINELNTLHKLDLRQQAEAKKALAKAKADLGAEQDRAKAELQKAKDALADIQGEMKKSLTKVDEDYKAVVAKFEKNIIAAETYTKEIQKLRTEKNRLEAKYNALERDTQIKINRLEEKIPQVDLLAYDQPKGKVVRIDRGGTTAYINLGRADLAKPGLSFSVFGVGEYKPNAERKGSIEIINVISDHLSSARITEVKSATRDPLLTGDLLFNPAWSPGLKEHVAVAGLIDLTGDGRDGTMEFVNNLERQGVVVDAYLDIKEMVIKKKGEGINRQTSYLVLGDIPDFDKQAQIREGDPRTKLKLKINAEISALREKAIQLGVTIVPARKFMSLVGYKLPRTRSSLTDWNSYLMRTQPGIGNINRAK